MKIGVSIVTCDRPNTLLSTINSLKADSNVERVIVDNGSNTRKEVISIAQNTGYTVIDGDRSNSPHGQNLAFEYLSKKGCGAILKSDDDLIYEPNYLDKLFHIFIEYDSAAAVAGICWSASRSEYIDYINEKWCFVNSEKKVNAEQFAMYRFIDPTIVWKTRHLHGAFLYSVKDALKLQERTKDIRGGVFGEYFSQVAGREETEFTLMLRQVLHKDLLVVPHAIVFHQYASGGTRKFDVSKLVREDVIKFINTCKKLGVDSTTSPAWIEPIEKINTTN